jgi:hypothetical protein
MSLRSAALALTRSPAAAWQTFDGTSWVAGHHGLSGGRAPQGEAFKLNQSSVYPLWGVLTTTTLARKSAEPQLVGKSVTT